jgi:SAM-dependent methyltransferase
MLNIDGEFNVVECKNCLLIYLNQQPEQQEIKKYYPNEYTPYGLNPLLKIITKIIAKLDAKDFKKYLPDNARILEIGCSSGEYLSGLRDERNWEITGIDVSKHAISIAKKTYNLNVICKDLFECKFEDNYFDLVILRYVLEHLHNPDDVIKEIKRILKDNGLIYLVIPNSDTIERKIFKQYWCEYDVPRHLFLFSINTITELLKKNKFKILHLKHSIVPNNWIMSIKYYLKDKNFSKILVNFFDISNPLLLLIFTPISILLSIFKNSGRIKILAKKV